MGMPARRRATRAQTLSGCCTILLVGLIAWDTARAVDSDPATPDEPVVVSGDTAPASAQDPPLRAVGGVTVTATGGERDALEVPGHVTVIDREAIDRSGARSVPELLKRQPGLFFTSSTSNPAGVQIESRGFANGAGNGSSLLVQVNGRRVNEADSSVADWATLGLDDVERIEILRGPASALYGDNAIGGVINIITRPVEGPPRVTTRASAGSTDRYAGSVKAAGTVGVVTGSIYGSGLTTDAYRHGADFDDEDVSGTLQTDLWDRVQVGVGGGRYHDDRGAPGALTQDEIDDLGRRARDPDSVGTGSAVERWFVDGWLDAALTEDLLFRFQSYYRQRDDDSDSVFASGAGLSRGVTDQSSLGVAGKLQWDRPIFGHRNRLIGGIDFLRDEADRTDITTSEFFDSHQEADNTKEVHAVFVQEEFNLTETLLLSAGVRYDHAAYDLAVLDVLNPMDRARARPDYDVWSPKAALSWRFRPDASAYFSYARGFRLPNFNENVPTLTGGPPEIPDLDVQKSHSYEIGGSYAGERAAATAAFYWMDVDDEIIFNPLLNCFPDFGCFGQNDNFDRVRHRGVELTLEVQIAAWLRFYGNYTFDDVVVTRSDVSELEGARMPITPRNRGNLGLVFEAPCSLEFTAHATFVGDRIVANDFDRMASKLDSYATLDLLWAWRPRVSEHLSGALTFGLQNVTASGYNGLAVRSTTDPSIVGFYPAAKRTWNVGLALTVER